MDAAGRLDRRVQLQSPTTARDDLGGHTESWTTEATVWAQVRDASGRELFQAQQAGMSVAKIVSIRYRSGVVAKWRVLNHDGTALRIGHIQTEGRNEWLNLFCEIAS